MRKENKKNYKSINPNTLRNEFQALNFKLQGIAGQSLIESIVALSVLVVGLLGIAALLTRSLATGKFITNNYVATYLAAEGVEVVKNLIDANSMQAPLRGWSWDCGFNEGDYEVFYDGQVGNLGQCPGQVIEGYAGRELRYDSTKKLYVVNGIGQVPFVRRITITRPQPGDPEEWIQVDSRVTWRVAGTQSTMHLEDRFYNWRP